FHCTTLFRSSAKDAMVNAVLLGQQFNTLLPQNEVPERTEGYEGFYHLMKFDGDVEQAKLYYIIRDHDSVKFDLRKKRLVEIQNDINSHFEDEPIEIEMNDQYYNMRSEERRVGKECK